MNDNNDRPNILLIGGGSGISNVVRGLKKLPVDITVIVTMFDSGGSSGLLQEEFGYPAFGDLRQCLLALSDDNQDTQALREALAFRFGAETSLNGHSVGNLLLAALTSLHNDLEAALEKISQVLHVQGSVIPVTLDKSDLCAELADGRIIEGESNIDLRRTSLPPIKRLFLSRDVEANPKAIDALINADAIVFGPGDLYTSILPNMLAKGMTDAVAKSEATRIYVSNLMTKRGETDGYTAADFIESLLSYVGHGNLDWAIVNSTVPGEEIQKAYEEELAEVVEVNIEELESLVPGVIPAPIATNDLPWRHDSDMTAQLIFKTASLGRGDDSVNVQISESSIIVGD